MIVGCKENNVLTLYYCIEYKFCSGFSRKSVKDFCIFFQDFIGYAKCISSRKHRQPYIMIDAFG